MSSRVQFLKHLAIILCSVIWTQATDAATVAVYGPICDANARVLSTTYYSCSSSSHIALDIGNGTCGSWSYRAMLSGNWYYTLYGGCGQACYGSSCNGGAGNYYVVVGSSGWDFRQLHMFTDAGSSSKTCNRCALGLVGGTGSATSPHVHADNRQYGTRKSAWYTSAGTTCGSKGDCNTIVGYATL